MATKGGLSNYCRVGPQYILPRAVPKPMFLILYKQCIRVCPIFLRILTLDYYVAFCLNHSNVLFFPPVIS